MAELSVLLSVRGLVTYYPSPKGHVQAVDGVTFELRRGEFLGLVGESGSGKSTLAMSVLRLVASPGRIIGGMIELDGLNLLALSQKELRLVRWTKIALVAQGAMSGLDPLYTVEQQIGEALRAHNCATRKEVSNRVRVLLQRVGIEPARANSYPHELSGGMKQRVMIAMALACSPLLMVADEPTSALDVVSSSGIIRLLKHLRSRQDLSMIFVTHDLAVAAQLCDRIGVMYAGKLIEVGSVADVLQRPQHPYTRALIESAPTIVGVKERLKAIAGEPPELVNPSHGCRFAPRCAYTMEICVEEEPASVEVGDEHTAACHLHSPSGLGQIKPTH